MHGFEVPFRTQVDNVLAGKTADGKDSDASWPLPDVVRWTSLRTRLMELAYWHLCCTTEQQRARDEVRTFVLWATAAHLSRLTRRGNTLDTASREISWVSRMMLENPAFMATCGFARKLMPDILPATQPGDRRDIRDDVLEILRICRTRWNPRDEQPFTEVHDHPWSVAHYTMPIHFLSNPRLAPAWSGHIAAMSRRENVDHAYWTDLAHDRRLVFALFVHADCKAVFESHGGTLDRLTVFEPAGEKVFVYLSSALTRLRRHHGDVFAIPPVSRNPAVQTLISTRQRRAADVGELLDRATASRQQDQQDSTPPDRIIPGTTDQWISGVVIAAVLSYIIPVLIIIAPDIGRDYVRAWRLALGMEPACGLVSLSSPERPCVPSRKRGDRLDIPIPPRR